MRCPRSGTGETAWVLRSWPPSARPGGDAARAGGAVRSSGRRVSLSVERSPVRGARGRARWRDAKQPARLRGRVRLRTVVLPLMLLLTLPLSVPRLMTEMQVVDPAVVRSGGTGRGGAARRHRGAPPPPHPARLLITAHPRDDPAHAHSPHLRHENVHRPAPIVRRPRVVRQCLMWRCGRHAQEGRRRAQRASAVRRLRSDGCPLVARAAHRPDRRGPPLSPIGVVGPQ